MPKLIDCVAAVSFDLDGTLIDTAPDLGAAANMMLVMLGGRPLPEDPKARQRLGAFLVRRGFDPETVRATLRTAAAESTPGGSTAEPDGEQDQGP